MFLNFPAFSWPKKFTFHNAPLVLPVVGENPNRLLVPHPSKEGIWSLNGVFGAAWGPLEQIISSQGEGNGEETKHYCKSVLFPNIGIRDVKEKGILEKNKAFPSSQGRGGKNPSGRGS